MPVLLSRILHAGAIFESQGTRVLFDPIFENPFSKNCYAFPAVTFDLERIRLERFSAVFLSHFHDDHCSLESLALLDRETPIYLYCHHDELFSWLRALGFRQVHALSLNCPVKIGPFVITPLRALDADVDSIFSIECGELKILNVVDSWIDPVAFSFLKSKAPWDVVLWPFQTMRELAVLSPTRADPPSPRLPPEWMEQLQLLTPRVVIPSSCQFIHESWSWYNHALFPVTYRQFQAEVNAALPHTEVQRLEPSQSLMLNNTGCVPGPPLPFVKRLTAEAVDYTFIPELPAQPTSEIARHFPALSPEQAHRVFEYCTRDLAAKYASLDQPEEFYFSRPRHWELRLFDAQGAFTRLFFRVFRQTLKLLPEPPLSIEWSTEVISSKLFFALERGETLSSMYIRINALGFSPEIEAQLREVDPTIDPLIRCLFEGVFGAYQKAQLDRILTRACKN